MSQRKFLYRPGTQVRLVNCVEARTDHKQSIWTTRSESFFLGSGEEVVLLVGKCGGFSVDCLELVK